MKETNKPNCQNMFIKTHRLEIKVQLLPFTIVKHLLEMFAEITN